LAATASISTPSPKAEIDRHIRELRTSKTLPGETVRLPGEERARRRADRLRNGLFLPPELLAQLDKLAAELSIATLAARRVAGSNL
jgi:LDH2 family malate/lactate/ureidoglycolate dehydrogenase